MEEKKKLSQKELEHLFEQATERGAVQSVLHFDAHGSNKEAVEGIMVDLVARLSKERGVLYCTGEIDRAMEGGDLYSCAAEVKLLTDSFNSLLNVAIRYGPIAAEILRPSKIQLSLEEAQSCILDTASSSHEFTNFLLERMMTKEDFLNYQKQMHARAELGKQLAEGKTTEPKPANGTG